MLGIDGDGHVLFGGKGEDAVGHGGGEGAGEGFAALGDLDLAEGEELPGGGQAGGVALDARSADAEVLHGECHGGAGGVQELGEGVFHL